VVNGDEFLRKEKLRLIADILSYYFIITTPNPHDPFWYGTVFDGLYDKDIIDLHVTSAVYKKIKNKNHI
jgi:hypothetical protein